MGQTALAFGSSATRTSRAFNLRAPRSFIVADLFLPLSREGVAFRDLFFAQALAFRISFLSFAAREFNLGSNESRHLFAAKQTAEDSTWRGRGLFGSQRILHRQLLELRLAVLLVRGGCLAECQRRFSVPLHVAVNFPA